MHSVKNVNRQKKNELCCEGCDPKTNSKIIRTREKRNWKKEL